MLRIILKDREFNSSNEIEEAITKVWDKLTLDGMQSVFHNWMVPLTWILENEDNKFLNKHEIVSSRVVNLKLGGGREFSLYTVFHNAQLMTINKFANRFVAHKQANELMLLAMPFLMSQTLPSF
jgi:hypothetical protein